MCTAFAFPPVRFNASTITLAAAKPSIKAGLTSEMLFARAKSFSSLTTANFNEFGNLYNDHTTLVVTQAGDEATLCITGFLGMMLICNLRRYAA